MKSTLGILAWFLALWFVPQEADFPARADALRNAKQWAELESLALEQLARSDNDLVAHANLAVACAGKQELDACVRALRDLEAAGHSVDDALTGFGVPMANVVNTVYSHCWADWNAEPNRRLWHELFEAFPASAQADVPASRLLMAALKLDDEAEAKRLDIWFEERREGFEPGDPREARSLSLQARAYARAGVGGAHTLALARGAFELQWLGAADRHGLEGAEGDEALARRELCDLDCDKAYNDLALAAFLSEDYDPAQNPLLAREPEPGAVFEDATEELGLGGLTQTRVAVGDFDNDGDPDLCLQGLLLRNEKGRRFVDVSQELGVTARGASALFGDYDGDGDLDLVLPTAPYPRLFANGGKRAKFTFEDVTAASGLDALKLEATPEGAAWIDLDGNGRLDLYLAVYQGEIGAGKPDVLARGRDDGTFEGIVGVGGVPTSCGRGVAPADFDNDGDLDLYVSNYRLNRNFLLRNDDGGLTDVAEALHVEGLRQPADGSYYGHTIGSCWGDVDGDGDLDLFCANLAHPRFIKQGFSNLSMLYMNVGEGTEIEFRDERHARGIRFQETHSDPSFADYDNDGDLDLFLTCVYEGVPSALFQNDGSGHFAPVTFGARALAFHGWGHAWLDHDDDGDLDLIVASGAGVRFFRNRGNANHWLKVEIRGKRNRFGLGARVTLETLDEESPRTLVRELPGARGTTSQDGTTLHFGLGDYSGKVRLRATWPGRKGPLTKTVRTDRTVVLR